MPTKGDWDRYVADLDKQRARDPRGINEAYLRQAAVDASLLTGHPGWDTYLQNLQAALDRAKASRDDFHTALERGLPDDQLRQAIYGLLQITATIETLELCMSLPKEILTHAHDTLDK